MSWMSAEQITRERKIAELLITQLSNFQELLSAYQNSECEYLVNNPDTRDRHQINKDTKLVALIRNETTLFLQFLNNSTGLTYKHVYTNAFDAAWLSATTFTTFSPTQAMFHLYPKRLRLNTTNLSLSLLRVEAYPRNTLEYITDTIRSMLHYLDKLITMISHNKQTMRDTYTPGASFLGKKHFIEPSTRVGLQEKLSKLFQDGQSSLEAQLQCLVKGN